MISKLQQIQTELKAHKSQTVKNRSGAVMYHYRNCEDILEALKPLLSKHNAYLTITDEIKQIGDRYYIEATATVVFEDKTASDKIISTKAYAREPLSKGNMDDAQVTGATSSYARKYALNGLFAIDDTKDADFAADQKEESKPNPPLTTLGKKQVGIIINMLKTHCANWSQGEKESYVHDKLGIKNISNIVFELNSESENELDAMIEFLQKEINIK